MTILTPKQSLKKAFLKVKHTVAEIENFKQKLHNYFDSLDTKQHEENNKAVLRDFLLATHFSGYDINTDGRIDLALKEKNSANLQILFEVKRPSNTTEMITDSSVNRKAMQEILYYYLQELHTNNNTSLKHLIITNCHDVYIFDALVFYSHFGKNQTLKKEFLDFEAKSASGSTTDYFYKEIAPKYVENIDIECTKFSFEDYKNADDTKIVELFKILSPEHLLKLPFANDSNTLNTKFYSELLHIIGLEERPEAKGSSKKIIARKEVGKRNNGSLLENCIHNLLETNELDDVPQLEKYGETEEEIVFSVALELCIVWINRILFLKLLEGQLVAYNNNDPKFRFLNINCFPEFDSLKGLFFGILARQDRSSKYAGFDYIPYLNSSLFEPTPLEQSAIQISNLSDNLKIPILSDTVLKDANGAPIRGNKNTLEYLYEFLDAYDFSSNASDVLTTEKKTLINASVLGLIFEKINGYKDGSFFTPGFITMYMCRETIERAMIQRFNERKGWKCQSITDVINSIEDRNEANDIFNSITICDPAVGSGHFLVSSLNELIALKFRMKILTDRKGEVISKLDYDILVENDELIVLDSKGNLFQYNKDNKESQRIQETMFHEKQLLIERCLFGVDINENSVKICRLRLWIELLKYAYYRTDGSGLETLPNLDIKIKTGNSLLSRFPIDIDLKEGLRQSTHGIEGYKAAVQMYKKASSKKEKDDCLAIINQCKSEIRLAGEERHPLQVRLNTAVQELHKLNTEISFLEPSPKEKKQKDALEKTIATLSEEINNWKEKKQYANAFEWRFEFPEILDTDGNFLGFDIIIGNPPYIVNTSLLYKDYEWTGDYYTMFIELAIKRISKINRFTSLITPRFFLFNKSNKELRRYIVNEVSILGMIECSPFEVVTENLITFFNKSKPSENYIDIFEIIETEPIYKNRYYKEWILQNEYLELTIHTTKFVLEILNKMSKNTKQLGNVLKSKRGAEIGKSKLKESTGIPCLIGSDIQRFETKFQNTFIDSQESEYIRLIEIFRKDDIILLRRVSKDLVATITNQKFAFNKNLYGLYLVDKEYSLNFLLALLNSKALNFYYKNRFSTKKEDVFPEIQTYLFEQLPIPQISEQEQRPFEELVEQILTKKERGENTDEEERRLDEMVYSLYHLTPDEINHIEGKE